MSGKRHDRVARLFLAACELPEADRDAYLSEACGEDDSLRARVEALLERDDDPDTFLERPALGPDFRIGTAPPADDRAEQHVPERIDDFRILDRLGEGGMGVVYRSMQEQPVRREVALKIIKLGMDTRQVVARFEAERQALALMSHPGIARVLDGGATETGRPYFVMELVEGVPFTEYCEAHGLGTRERLRLFIEVCHAVQHAHQKGVIHRDLKPSNVLVSGAGADAAVKVIDFGIAKAIGERLSERSYVTDQVQLMGTPEYMSPEQAGTSELDVDTRTDVYSLGVLLYALLTGTTPFDPETMRSGDIAAVQRVIREDEPERPSTRVIAGDRRPAGDRAVLHRELRGDLDWIVMRCLEKDRSRRYQTAAALADDIERHLRHEPVEAGPPRAAYRIGKFVRRNRVAVVSGVLLVLALLAGVVGTTWGMLGARQAARATAAVNEFMTEVLTAPDPRHRGADVKLVDVLETASATAPIRFDGHPELEADVRFLIGRVYGMLDMPALAEVEHRAALELRREHYGDDDPRTLRVVGALAQNLISQRRRDEAEPLVADLLERRRRVLGVTHHETLAARVLAAHLMIWSGRYDEATAELRELMKRCDALGSDDPLTLDVQAKLYMALTHHAFTMAGTPESQALFREAEPIARSRLSILERVAGPDDYRTLGAMCDAAAVAEWLEAPGEAARLARLVLDRSRSTLGEHHRMRLRAAAMLGDALHRLGRSDEATEWRVFNVEGHRRRDGDGNPDTLAAMASSLHVLEAGGAYERGEEYARIVYEKMDQLMGPDQAVTRENRLYVAHFLARQGRLDEAGPHFEALVSPGPESAWVRSRFGVFHAEYLIDLERFDEAEAELLAAIDGIREQGPWSREALQVYAMEALVDLYERQGLLEKAAGYREALADERARMISAE